MLCTSKNICCQIAKYPLLANADKILKYKIERLSETEEVLLLSVWQRPQEHFNRHFPVWHPYTPTFDMIPHTLKTLERYFPGLIEHIRVCGLRSGFSVVIRFAKSALQNINVLVVVIHTPAHIEKAFWGWFTRGVVLYRWMITLLTFHTRNKNDNSWHIVNSDIVNWATSH